MLVMASGEKLESFNSTSLETVITGNSSRSYTSSGGSLKAIRVACYTIAGVFAFFVLLLLG